MQRNSGVCRLFIKQFIMKHLHSIMFSGIIFCGLLLWGCEPAPLPEGFEPQEEGNCQEARFVGSWTWIKTIRYFVPDGPEIDTPDTEGYHETYVFGEDLSFTKLRDGAVVSEGTYRLDTLHTLSTAVFQVEFDASSGPHGTFWVHWQSACAITLDQSPVDGPQIFLEKRYSE